MEFNRVFIFFILLCSGQFISAQNKYALIIGIDEYSPPIKNDKIAKTGRRNFPNLQGCKNDGRAIRSIINTKFGFASNDIDTLFDEEASRSGIMDAIQLLLSKSKRNDIVLIYYAGHGSQVKNSLSLEKDGYDESIVPCDAWKENVADIRDKELAIIFNQFIDKGVKLTVITDCCHSGSLSRGVIVQPRLRYIASNNLDAADSSQPVPPESRPGGHFLIFNAAQDNEFAQEERDDNGNMAGAFTNALIKAINQLPNDISALSLYSSLRAVLKGNGRRQEPVLSGTNERLNQTLFGLKRATMSDKILLPVIRVNNNKVELQGGLALGLSSGIELLRVYSKDSVIIRVDSVKGIDGSNGSVIMGSIKNIKPGDFFEICNWVVRNAPLIKIYVPTSNIKPETVARLKEINTELKLAKHVVLVTDIEKHDPAISIYYFDEKYYVNNKGKQTEITELKSQQIPGLFKRDDSVYVEIPAFAEVADAVTKKFKGCSMIRLVNEIEDAHYVLYGTIDDNGQLFYGLRKLQVAARDSLEALPLITTLIPISMYDKQSYTCLADSIYNFSLRLAKIRGWLNLVSPGNSKILFPYAIQLMNNKTGMLVDPLTYKLNDDITFHLVTTVADLALNSSRKYVYVFCLDKNGKITLAYPDKSDGNVENKFPRFNSSGKIQMDNDLFSFQVTEPIGIDNFFLLATEDPLSNYQNLFTQDAVKGIDRRGVEKDNALSHVLNMRNEDFLMRGLTIKTPANWCLIRLSVKSTY